MEYCYQNNTIINTIKIGNRLMASTCLRTAIFEGMPIPTSLVMHSWLEKVLHEKDSLLLLPFRGYARKCARLVLD